MLNGPCHSFLWSGHKNPALRPSSTKGRLISHYDGACNSKNVQDYHSVLPLQLGILPYAGVDIAAFEIFKEKLLKKYDNQPPPILILGAGMLSSSIAQFASYPLALVRTRLQVGLDKPLLNQSLFEIFAVRYLH